MGQQQSRQPKEEAKKEWETFRDWEFKVCAKLEPEYPMTALHNELLQEWNRISLRPIFIASLQDVQASQRSVAKDRAKVRTRRASRDDDLAQTWFPGDLSARKQDDLRQALSDALGTFRLAIEDIKALQYEQQFLGTTGVPNSNPRSIQYSANLLKTLQDESLEMRVQLDDCEQWLRQYEKEKASHNKKYRRSHPAQDRDGQDGGQGAQPSQSRGPRDRNSDQDGQDQHGGRQSSGNRNAGAGAGAPGGNDGDEGGDRRRVPPSRNNVFGAAEKSEEDEDDGVDEDQSEDLPDYQDELYHNSEIGDNANQPQRAHQQDHVPGVVPPLVRSQEGAVQDIAPGMPFRAVVGSQPSQELGADRPPRDQAGDPGNCPENPRVGANAGAPGAPDGGDSPSDDNDVFGQDPKSPKRRASDRDKSDDENGHPRRSKRKRKTSDSDRNLSNHVSPSGAAHRPNSKSAAPGAPVDDEEGIMEARMLSVPAHVQQYHLVSLENGDLPPATANAAILRIVLRLFDAFGGDEQFWETLPPIEHYLTPDGREKPGTAMYRLRGEEWDSGWDLFFENIQQDPALMDAYDRLKVRLGSIGRFIPPPAPALGEDALVVLESYQERVACEERVAADWEEYIEEAGNIGGRSGARRAISAHREAMERLDNRDPAIPIDSQEYGPPRRPPPPRLPFPQPLQGGLPFGPQNYPPPPLQGGLPVGFLQYPPLPALQGGRPGGPAFYPPPYLPQHPAVRPEPIPRNPSSLPGLPGEDPERYAKEAQRIGFDNANIAGIWTFLESAGRGGGGHAGIWVRYDASGRILERKVVKETWLGKYYWGENSRWNNPHDRINLTGGRMLREVCIYTYLTSRIDQAFNIVQLDTCRLYPLKYMYRLYMEYCEQGDLEELIQSHQALRRAQPVDQAGNLLSWHIPTPVIWCIFEALVSVACLMRDGHIPTDMPPNGWAGSMLHRDIKPKNVFLTGPDQLAWKGIPVPKVGDFGFAVEQSFCPYYFSGGTKGYMAPEAVHYEDWPYPERPYNSASEVYCIGRLMMSLINLESSDEVYQYGFHDEYRYARPTTNADAITKYPPKLLTLIRDCVKLEPAERPDLVVLWGMIWQEVGTSQGLRGLPLRNQELREGDIIRYKPDRYAAWAK